MQRKAGSCPSKAHTMRHCNTRSPRAGKRAREDEDGLERYLRDLGHRGGGGGGGAHDLAAGFDDMPALFPEGDALPYQLADLPHRQAPVSKYPAPGRKRPSVHASCGKTGAACSQHRARNALLTEHAATDAAHGGGIPGSRVLG